MNTNSSEDRTEFAAAAKNLHHSEALERRARIAAAFSRFFSLLAAFGLAMAFIGVWVNNQGSPTVGFSSQRAQEMEALKRSGGAMGIVIFSFSSIVFSVLGFRFARKWARAASESIASSEGENRRLLQITRSSSLPFALYLRGFEEEGRSFQTLFAMPLSTKRVDKATRWIESELVDELKRRE